MAVALDLGSATIDVRMRPQVRKPQIAEAATTRGFYLSKVSDDDAQTPSEGTAAFTCTRITANGSVRLTGAPGDSAAGWELGFIQVQWCETNLAYYRGRSDRDFDGSIVLDRGKPPARPSQGCRDTSGGPASGIWYDTRNNSIAPSTCTYPITLEAKFLDRPGDWYSLVEPNSLTGSDNYLHEAQIAFGFCTVLAARAPDRSFHQLLSFCWNVRWAAQFSPPSSARTGSKWSIVVLPAGTGSTVSRIIKGEVTDHRFRRLITGPATQVCGQIAGQAAVNVASTSGGRRERWHW